MATLLLDSDIAFLLDIANAACHKGLPDAARKIVHGVLAEKPDFVPAKVTEAYSHLVVDDFTTALEILDPIFAKNTEDPDARVVQGLALLLADRKSEALEAFGHIASHLPQKTLADELARAL